MVTRLTGECNGLGGIVTPGSSSMEVFAGPYDGPAERARDGVPSCCVIRPSKLVADIVNEEIGNHEPNDTK